MIWQSSRVCNSFCIHDILVSTKVLNGQAIRSIEGGDVSPIFVLGGGEEGGTKMRVGERVEKGCAAPDNFIDLFIPAHVCFDSVDLR